MATIRDIITELLTAALYEKFQEDGGAEKLFKKERLEDLDQFTQDILNYVPPAATLTRARAAPKKTKGEQFTADDHRDHLDVNFDAGFDDSEGKCAVYHGKAGDEEGKQKYCYCGKNSKKFKHVCLRHVETAQGKKIAAAEKAGNFDINAHYGKTEKTRIKHHKDALKELGQPWVDKPAIKGKLNARETSTVFSLVRYSPDKDYRYEAKHHFVIESKEDKAGKITQHVVGCDDDQDGEIRLLTLDEYNIVKRKGPSVTVAEEALDEEAAEAFNLNAKTKNNITKGKTMIKQSDTEEDQEEEEEPAPKKINPPKNTLVASKKIVKEDTEEDEQEPIPKKKIAASKPINKLVKKPVEREEEEEFQTKRKDAKVPIVEKRPPVKPLKSVASKDVNENDIEEVEKVTLVSKKAPIKRLANDNEQESDDQTEDMQDEPEDD